MKNLERLEGISSLRLLQYGIKVTRYPMLMLPNERLL